MKARIIGKGIDVHIIVNDEIDEEILRLAIKIALKREIKLLEFKG